MGMTVRHMLRTMPAEELSRWAAYKKYRGVEWKRVSKNGKVRVVNVW